MPGGGWRTILFLLACSLLGCQAQTPQPARQESLIDTNWKFLRADPPNAQSPDFNDTTWQPVTLPHTWNLQDGLVPGDHYYRGPAWYRLTLNFPAINPTRQYFLRFDAASLAAKIFINGQLAGAHQGGFSAFCFNITPFLHPGQNLIAVRVDNSVSQNIPPISGDFTVFGGLYRDAHLLNLNSVSISPTDDASPGIYLTTTHLDQSTATISATVILRNDSAQIQTVAVTAAVRDSAGQPVATSTTSQTVPAHSTGQATIPITIPHPHLWNGKQDPYLYTTSISLTQSGTLLDELDQPLGLRTFRVDPNHGFFLNGTPYPLHGVGLHQGFYNKGWAATPADIDINYQLIEEIGANALRLAHYQHSDYEYSLCDRRGLIVWAEIPLINRIIDNDAYYTIARQQLRELIKQNYNHPSICFWSLWNELGPHTRTDWRLPADLNELAHQLDPTRLTVAASHLPPEIAVNTIPDAIAFNRYPGWYLFTLADWPAKLAELHATLPNSSIGISEYGAGASIRQHVPIPAIEPNNLGQWHPEEWQSQFHEAAYSAMQKCPWLWGTFVWNMFDFPSSERFEGDEPAFTDKGLVTYDRKTKKDAFYYYKAHWNTDPFVYITSRRATPRPAGTIEIKIYSNCATAELFINGRSLGIRQGTDDIFLWPDVQLIPGQNELSAVAKSNGKSYTDSCTWIVLPR
jgi:beta-galactosidase